MMRSLFAGVSGLKNHQTRMDVIGNNIANVNTVGFKAARVNFQDVLSQTLQGASSGGNNRGGTNPLQVGLGMGLASIDTIFTDGSFQPTGKQTDLSIQGQGFFILSDGENQVYTRAGAFDFDNQGNFLVPGTGYKVMGWTAKDDGSLDTTGDVKSIQVPVGKTMAAKATDYITYSNNLSSEAGLGTIVPSGITVYDSQGVPYNITGDFKKEANNQWSFTPAGSVKDKNGVEIATVDFDPPGGKIVLNFDTNGKFILPGAATNPSIINDITITPNNGTDPIKLGAFNATTGKGLNFTSLTQYGGESTVKATDQGGYPDGTLDTVSIDPSGTIVGRFTNGQSFNLAQVALATFNNPAGLTKAGDSLFTQSNNSGVAQIGPSGSGGRGKFNPGTLEMSNVDLAQEFSNMIITQRGFQANSKIISTTDEMLQELANLKR